MRVSSGGLARAKALQQGKLRPGLGGAQKELPATAIVFSFSLSSGVDSLEDRQETTTQP